MTRIAIGIMVHNEAGNLPALLTALEKVRLPGCGLDPVVVVSSGSTDGSDDILRQWQAREPRNRLLLEARRTGKASAINLFLRALPPEVEICVLVNADLLPEPDAIARLVAPFVDPRVGMTGARPMPTNPRSGMLNRVVHLQWNLHHRVALVRPKLGEMVAFRPMHKTLDPDTPVDEASLEAMVTSRGMELAYVAEALVWNRGPRSLGEFMRQRCRIWIGHVRLRQQTGYEVATYRLHAMASPVLHEIRESPAMLPVVLVAAGLEVVARVLGTFSYRVLGSNPVLWSPIPSSKVPFQDG